MVDIKTKLFPKTTADRIIEAYADVDELKPSECEEIGIEESCEDMMKVLNGTSTVRDGYMTKEERSYLLGKGYSERFVNALYGKSGARAAHARQDALLMRLNWSEDRDDRIRATSELLYSPPPTVPALREAANDQDRTLSGAAIGGLGSLGPSALPALIEIFKTEGNERLRIDAGTELFHIGSETTLAVVSMLKDDNASVRADAAGLLASIKPNSPHAVSALLEVVEDEDASVRRNAIRALGEIRLSAITVVPALIKAIEDEDASVRDEAVYALSQYGNEAQRAVPAIVRAIEGDRVIKFEATVALLKIRPSAEGLVPTLQKVIEEGDEDVKTSIMSWLAAVVTWNEEVVPALIEALKDESEAVQEYAVAGLNRIQSPSEETISALTKMLDYSTPVVRLHAAFVLGGFGPAANPALPKLKAMADDEPNNCVREMAKYAVERIEAAE